MSALIRSRPMLGVAAKRRDVPQAAVSRCSNMRMQEAKLIITRSRRRRRRAATATRARRDAGLSSSRAQLGCKLNQVLRHHINRLLRIGCGGPGSEFVRSWRAGNAPGFAAAETI